MPLISFARIPGDQNGPVLRSRFDGRVLILLPGWFDDDSLRWFF